MQSPGTSSFHRGADRILGGVCSGLAEGFHVELLWVRVAFVVLAFINGVGLLLYVVLWVLMPEQAGYKPAGQNAFEAMGADIKRAWVDLKSQFGGGPSAAATPAPTATVAPIAVGSAVAGESQGVSPASPTAAPLPATPVGSQRVTQTPTFIFGAILVVLGIAFLAANSGISWDVILPAGLIVLGVVLLVRNLERRA
jgi:phage shock protein PspC (stress-responsive transcriptional regulator)